MQITETVSLTSLGYDEAWLQEQIWNNPSLIGLGELESVLKERAVSSGGKLDILLKNPVNDSMYEVEVMLGDTDASHIIRTIEYWDLVRRKWPQRQHFAVLIAERITMRFFNVIQILSGSVPRIAIQVSAIKTPSMNCLHFTKILDVYEEIDDGSTEESGSYDDAFWQKKSPHTLDAAKLLFDATKDIYHGSRLVYCKHSVNIVKDGYNQMFVRQRLGTNVFIQFRHGSKKEDIKKLLEAKSIQVIDKHNQFAFTLTLNRLGEETELIRKIAELNHDWWKSEDAID